MAFLDPYVADSIRDSLVDDPAELKKLYRAKKNPYHLRSVSHSLVDDLLDEGWEEYTQPLKTKTKLRKEKAASEKFEDDIWCQLYELGYRCLNKGDNFVLPFGKSESETKQIDVVGVNEDSILLIECKSSGKPKKAPSFKTEIEGLGHRLGGFKKSLEQIFGKQRRIKFIFATRNLRMSSEGQDAQRLQDHNAFLYNDNTYEYVNSLIKHYKDAALYQFLALIFKGQIINKDRVEVPAVQGKMGNLKYYMFSIEPHLLLRMGFILHRTRANESEMPTYQRLLVPSRLKGISKFIENGGYFPNSVIVNFSDNWKPQFEAASKGDHSISRAGTLKIPNAFAIAYIIDGQHRIYGYANTPFRETNTIPVVAFVGLDSHDQLKLFMDINQNQKAVSPTLRLTLEEDLYWSSSRADSRMKALRSSIIRLLSSPVDGPLHNKISIGEDKAELSAKPFADAISKSGLLPTAKGNKFQTNNLNSVLYNPANQNHNAEMRRAQKTVVRLLNACYEFVEDRYPEIFDSEQFILSNRGTFAFICLIGGLHRHECDKGALSPTSDPDTRFDAISKYLEVLLTRLSNLEDSERETLLSKLGSGAGTVWLRLYESFVNEKFSDFEPVELVDWKERQDDDLQAKGRELGIEIERHMKKRILDNLYSLFGENWDLEIGSIKRDCENRANEEIERQYKEMGQRKEIPWTDMFFISDYKTIIEKYWTRKPEGENQAAFETFEEQFAIDIGHGFQSKKDKIKWISVFNSYRNLWAHEGTKEKRLNKEEVEFLQNIYDSLMG